MATSNISLCFIPIFWGKSSNLTCAYFSDGFWLKPPTIEKIRSCGRGPTNKPILRWLKRSSSKFGRDIPWIWGEWQRKLLHPDGGNWIQGPCRWWFRNPVNSPVEVGYSWSYYIFTYILTWCRVSSINSTFHETNYPWKMIRWKTRLKGFLGCKVRLRGGLLAFGMSFWGGGLGCLREKSDEKVDLICL